MLSTPSLSGRFHETMNGVRRDPREASPFSLLAPEPWYSHQTFPLPRPAEEGGSPSLALLPALIFRQMEVLGMTLKVPFVAGYDQATPLGSVLPMVLPFLTATERRILQRVNHEVHVLESTVPDLQPQLRCLPYYPPPPHQKQVWYRPQYLAEVRHFVTLGLTHWDLLTKPMNSWGLYQISRAQVLWRQMLTLPMVMTTDSTQRLEPIKPIAVTHLRIQADKAYLHREVIVHFLQLQEVHLVPPDSDPTHACVLTLKEGETWTQCLTDLGPPEEFRPQRPFGWETPEGAPVGIVRSLATIEPAEIRLSLQARLMRRMTPADLGLPPEEPIDDLSSLSSWGSDESDESEVTYSELPELEWDDSEAEETTNRSTSSIWDVD